MLTSRTSAIGMWGLYYRLLTSVVKESAEDVGGLGVDIKEFFVLDDVEQCPFPAELARRLSIPKATMTGYLRSLEAKGFLRREIDPGDLRRHRLTLTVAGSSTVTGARAVLSDRFGKRLARLDEAERRELLGLLEKLCS